MTTSTPPYIYLHQVADHIPETCRTFLFLWRARDDQNRVFVTKDEIIDKHFFPWIKFKNDIRKLALNDLCQYGWSEDVMVIELATPSEEVLEWYS